MMRKRWLMAAVVVGVGLWLAAVAGSQNAPVTPTPTVTSVRNVQPTDADRACCREGVATVPAGQQCVLLHKVGPGENLHILAAYYYGDARAWTRIYEFNRRAIGNPNWIKAGQVLRIEVPPCWVPKYDLQYFLQIEARRRVVFKPVAAGGTRVIKKEVVEPAVPQVTISTEEESKPEEPVKPARPAPKPKTEGN